MTSAKALADTMVLGALLEQLRAQSGAYELVAHWQQGEFHHDLILRLPGWSRGTPGPVVVVSTNCNGGVKEVLYLREAPGRWALWHHRCPENPEFSGELPEILDQARTLHWFDPQELLGPDARSELKGTHRQRQRGGGWLPARSPSNRPQ